MEQWKRNLFVIWLAQFLATTGFFFSTPFIPFYIRDLGVDDPQARNLWVAWYAAAGNLAFCIFAPIWGYLSDIFGRRVMVLRATFASALLLPLMAFVPGPAWLVALRFLLRMFSGTVTATQTLIAGTTPYANRGFALGALSAAVFSGTMAGMFLGGIVGDHFGYRHAFFVSASILFISGLLVLWGTKESFEKTTSLRAKLSTFQLRLPDFGAVWLILMLIMVMAVARRFDMPFLPVLIETVNGPEQAATWTGITACLAALAGGLAGILLGWLADIIPAPKIAMWSALLAGLLMVPQGLATGMAVLIGARCGMIFFAGGLDPIFQIWLAKSTPDRQRGLFFGWASSFKGFGWFLSSVLGGAVVTLFGVRGVYLGAAVLFILLVPMLRLTVRRLRAHESQ